MIIKAITNIFYFIKWKLRFGRRLSLGLPAGLVKTTVEKDRNATIALGARIQNRGPLFLACKQKGRLVIGPHCFFNINCAITCVKSITVGAYCKFGNNLVMVDHDHHRFKKPDNGAVGQNDHADAAEEFIAESIVIGERVWVGANCVILKGVTIGDDAVIAAGSIVRKDVAAGRLYRENRVPY